MKVVEVQGTKYYIYNKDDAVSLAHQLTKSGYTVQQIASILGVTEKTVRKYLSDCW